MKLSIIIPVYNESRTVLQILDKIEAQTNINKQIIIVDDCSTDNSLEKIKSYSFKSEFLIISHNKNCGKGACIKSAKTKVNGDLVLIQDADLEYDPKDYKNLIYPILNNNFSVVYGSRVLEKNRYFKSNFTSILRVFLNHMLTIFSNIVNNQNLTDAHTCYKLFKIEIFNNLNLIEDGFSFCPEVTTKIGNKSIQIKEVPINYYGRDYKDGKKIKFIDGIKAIIAIIKYKNIL